MIERISGITIAVTQMEAMVDFYNAVFGCELVPVPGTPFYAGHLLDLPLLFCPNAIAGVEAKKNRIQFDFVVDDLAACLAAVQQAGGSLYDDRAETAEKIVQGIKDPDGNSYVLIQMR